ncbi:MAG: glycosyltransferase family 1 protein [Candidatus Cloacimonadota bacterium]|nr:MAG: glycosyltransferase family 1 protein [Candidatus Cloacimonadota bacterium]RLC58336.1 MAG: glycosyltransferase family 1 protein [Candidatus Cloacimonadota bacterium]
MRKTRSIHVIRKFVFDEWGKTESVVWNLAKNLSEKGIDAKIAATNALSSKSFSVVDGVPINRFNYFYPYLNLKPDSIQALDRKGGNPYSYPLYKYLLNTRQVDILHCHTMERIANAVRLVAKKKKIPYVISFHGGMFEAPKSELNEMMKPLQGSFNYGKIIDAILKNNHYLTDVDGIVCAGYNEYMVTKVKFPDKVVEYIPNGVDVERYKIAGKNDFREKYQIHPDSELILCVGRIDHHKNQIKLIELLDVLKQRRENVHVLLIGPISSESYKRKLDKRIIELQLEKDVTFIHELKATDQELIKAYDAADFFILPSTHEPFGSITLEAWASRLPVIVHKVGGLRHLIKDNETGLFFSDNSLDDLVDKFYKMRDSVGARVRIIQNSYLEVSQKYSWSAVTDQLVEFYQKVITHYNTK